MRIKESLPVRLTGRGTMESQAETARSARPGWRTAVVLIVAFWVCYFVLVTAKAAIGGMPAQDAMLPRRAAVTLVAMGLTFLLYLLLDRFGSRSPGRLFIIALAATVPLAIAYASVNYLTFYVFFPIPEQMAAWGAEDMSFGSPLMMIAGSALDWYFFIASWSVMWIAISWGGRVQQAERQAAAYRQAARDAELRALRYQVNPHFLFNTLNSLSSLVLKARGDEAEQMILNLSNFFRASLAREALEDVPLEEEMALQRLYLDIEKIRFPERLRVEVLLPEALKGAMVPALILQPLVENAIKYGVSTTNRPVTLEIAAQSVGDRLEISVRDNGGGAAGADGRSSPTGLGVGLSNVRARLAARFGSEARLDHGPLADGGFFARLSMPLVA